MAGRYSKRVQSSKESASPERSLLQSTNQTHWRVKKKEEKVRLRARDQERLAEYGKAAVPSLDGKCGNCVRLGRICRVWPEGHERIKTAPSRKRACLECSTSNSRDGPCIFPEMMTASVQPESNDATISAFGRKPIKSYPVHTKEWFHTLPPEQQRLYKYNQIQWGGFRKVGGPCSNCVARGFPCMQADPESVIYEITKSKRCAKCILGNTGEGLVRNCTSVNGLSHHDHELAIDLSIPIAPAINWKHDLAQKVRELHEQMYQQQQEEMAWREEKTRLQEVIEKLQKSVEDMQSQNVSKENSSFYDDFSSDKSLHSSDTPSNTPNFKASFNTTTLEDFGLNPAKITKSVQTLDNLIKNFARQLASGCEILPLQENNIEKLRVSTSNETENSGNNVMSTLAYLLELSESSHIQARVRQLKIENLDYAAVTRGIISVFLMDFMFTSKNTPLEIACFRDALQRTSLFGNRPLLLEKTLEHYFGQVLRLPDDQNPLMKFAEVTASPAADRLYSAIKPLIRLIHDVVEDKLERTYRSHCFKICKAAAILNIEMKISPTCPAEPFAIFSGAPFCDLYHESESDVYKQVNIMVMFGVRGVDHKIPYAKARAVCTR